MLKLRKVAVTGGLSSGKSTVCHIFQTLGAYTVSADAIVHRLLATHRPLIASISMLIGSEVVVDEQIDRSKLAEKVFHHPEALHSLETLIHPLVFQEIESDYQRMIHLGRQRCFVAEIPLLFETEAATHFDTTICVMAPRELCLQRFIQATGLTVADYESRMQRQWSMEKKAALADFVISNQGNAKDLYDQVQAVYQVINR